jgi:carbamoyl-phosphate synthase small subunit
MKPTNGAHTPNSAFLLLSDGTVFYGTPHGARTVAVGELCFNTGMAGYQEVFTDPSYRGQIIAMTHTHIGTYGALAPDSTEVESTGVQVRAVVTRNFSGHFARAGAQGSLQQYLEQQGVPALGGVDTRALVRHIRTKGALNALVCTNSLSVEAAREQLAACPSMEGLELATEVSTREPYTLNPSGQYRVAVYDYGTKRNILRNLAARNCALTVFPAHTPAAELLQQGFEGFFLSNGPGDPATMQYAVQACRELLDSQRPVFGICLGHQLLAQALGLHTYKMPYGHRGVNHAVKNLLTGRSEITSQNHGFAVRAENFDQHPEAEITHLNLNDGTVAGLRSRIRPAFSVQYHPEANPGPHDSGYLFDQFIELMATRR